jgi:hypothetical protein
MRRFGPILLMILSACAHSSHLKYGVGLNDGPFPDTQVKIIGIGSSRPLGPIFDMQHEAGLFADNRSGLGPTGYVSPAMIGLETKGPGLYAHYFVGPSLITQTDQRLSSILEFENSFELGIRDYRGISLGANLTHFSNAGLWLPNMGRDFLGVRLNINF